MLEIDPTNIPEEYAPHLIRTFQAVNAKLISQHDAYHDEDIGPFRVKYSLIWWGLADGRHGFEIFDVKNPLAKGGQGIVYVSLGTLKAEEYRLIFLRTSRVIKVADEARFSSVEKALHRLPTRLRCKPMTVVNNYAYLVMEKLPGITLMQFLQERGPTLSVAERFMLSLAMLDELIEIVHAFKVCHRDIKPTNIMVQFNKRMPHVGIIDFGLSCFLEDEANDENCLKEREFQGTHVFVAPEQLFGLPAHQESDTFSVAIVMGLVLGVKLKQRRSGLGVFGQGIDYACHMNFHHALSVADLPRSALRAIEALLTRMSIHQPDLRMSLVDAKAKLVEIFINFESGVYDACKEVSTPRIRPLSQLPSCWLQRSPYREENTLPMPKSTSRLFSIVSEESSSRKSPSVGEDAVRSAMSPTYSASFFPSPQAALSPCQSPPPGDRRSLAALGMTCV
ncbi:MAG: protein kinase [Gammaproteobacteria bacterium]|nr:protein kinase [Gammaproteobacteria bacterium]